MKPIKLEIKTYEELKEELGNEYDTAMYEINLSALKEIERLNHIINELEKYIKTNAPREIRGNITGDYEVYIDGQFLFNKLQELKGDGSNE